MISECVTVYDEPDTILAESGRKCQSNLINSQGWQLRFQGWWLIRYVLRIRGQKGGCTEILNESLLN